MRTFKSVDPQQITQSMVDTCKVYNSRLTQMILGGGAKVTGQLKVISAKHLAASVISLTFLIDESHFVALQVTHDFPGSAVEQIIESLIADLNERRSAVVSKLQDIMTIRITKCCDVGQREIRWTEEPLESELWEESNYYLCKIKRDINDMFNILEQLFNLQEMSAVFDKTLEHLTASLLSMFSS